MDDYKNKRVALVGVSADQSKMGYKMFEDLLQNGFNVFGVNPKNGIILKQRIYTSLEEIKPLPDLVVTVVKPEITLTIIEQCHNLGIKQIWMQPGSESEQAIKKAKDYGIEVRHRKCFMSENGIW
ncbi:MAG TPA: CoA-binding protein [bacterium]|nr:CoA-binding protein [bacterium]HOL35285.1 CoA-binding protein [bacterium]